MVCLKRRTLQQNLLDKLKSLVQRYSAVLPSVTQMGDNLSDRLASEGKFMAGGTMPGDADILAGYRLGKAPSCPYLIFTMTLDLRP